MTVLIPQYSKTAEYTQTQEDTLAGSLTGKSYGSKVIWNITLLKIRVWNGVAFENMADIPSTALPLATSTTAGIIPATGTPSNKFLKDNLTWETITTGSAEKNLGGTINKDTANTFFTYLGEIVVEKGTTTTYLITTFVSAGTGTLKLYNFTTKADILSISVINTIKEIKSGTIDPATLVAGNNVIELWGKNTAGTIDVSSFQIKVV